MSDPHDRSPVDGDVATATATGSSAHIAKSPSKRSKLQRLRERYLQRIPSRIEEIARSRDAALAPPLPRMLTGGDPIWALKQLVHNMAGSAGGHGQPQLGERAAAVDILLRALDPSAPLEPAHMAEVDAALTELLRFGRTLASTADEAGS